MRSSIALLVLALAGSCAPTPVSAAPASARARPVVLSRAAADSIRKAVLADRDETKQWLREGATSYLAAVERRDFGDRSSLTVGSAAGNDVRVNDPEVSARHLRVTVVGDSFRVEALDDSARFFAGDAERRKATVGPSAIRVGRYNLRLSHQRFPAIIVFDPKSPLFARYKGLEWYPVDFEYRYELPLTPNPRPDTVIIASTRGHSRRAVRVGWFDFMVGNTPCRLEATRLLEPGVGEEDFGLFFHDATSGKETYALGRYVEAQPLPDGHYVLDFNFAYNPACAVSDHYNCPIPPKANRLKVAIRAGEKDAHYH